MTRKVNVCRTSLGAALAPGQSLRTLGALFPEIADRFVEGYPLPSTVYNPVVVSRIELPDGRQYTFRYTSYGRVARIVLPTRGRIEYDYAPMDVNLGSLSVRQRVAERRMISVGGGLEQRIVYSSAPGLMTVSTRDGGGNELVREAHAFFGDPNQPPAPALPTNYGKEFRAEVFQSGTLLRRTEHDWSNGGGSHDFAIVEERVSLHDGAGAGHGAQEVRLRWLHEPHQHHGIRLRPIRPGRAPPLHSLRHGPLVHGRPNSPDQLAQPRGRVPGPGRGRGVQRQRGGADELHVRSNAAHTPGRHHAPPPRLWTRSAASAGT